jgi:phosphotransferase system enzyme I (PtsI)
MLKNIDPIITAPLLSVLKEMGHGDEIVIVDTNFPAESIALQTRLGRLLRIDNVTSPQAAAAVLSLLPLDTFIDAIDFLSIGTNDLVQYLLAADRNNEALGELYSPLHPAVLRLIAQVIATGQAHAKPVAVCGEIAGDPALTPILLALGLREFSLHPATLLEVRRVIRDTDLQALRLRGAKLLQARDRKGIERWLAG